jgi:hypothetical protein
MKNILVVTHERTGTHLLINIINYENNGNFKSLGKLPSNNLFKLSNYIDYVNLQIIYEQYQPNIVFKSHHQIDFFEDLKLLFNNFKILYIKRDIKDTLLSYYRFLNREKLNTFPKLENWIFMKPLDVGNNILKYNNFPDPHIIIQPDNYIHRILLHQQGWLKYKDDLLIINYEDIINNFNFIKNKIEYFLNKKININHIPEINNNLLPNFYPNKGIIGDYKNYMNKNLINKIDNMIKKYNFDEN